MISHFKILMHDIFISQKHKVINQYGEILNDVIEKFLEINLGLL